MIPTMMFSMLLLFALDFVAGPHEEDHDGEEAEG
jgi:hypothetical protein